MKLLSNELGLVGQWVAANGQVRPDTTCERIEWLTTQHLRKIANSKRWGDWETLFQDPADGRLWERTFPQGEMQGGGPLRLTFLTVEQAQVKYEVA